MVRQLGGIDRGKSVRQPGAGITFAEGLDANHRRADDFVVRDAHLISGAEQHLGPAAAALLLEGPADQLHVLARIAETPQTRLRDLAVGHFKRGFAGSARLKVEPVHLMGRSPAHWPACLHAGIESLSEMQASKGQAFKDLHSGDGIFVMPNAWNAGSACMLEAAGFPAVGTTSAGISFCLGLPDYEGALSRDAALEETGRIAGALRIPVSVDAENGYGHTPEEVAETIRRVADTGAVGASIEDYAAAYGTGDLYDRALSVERIEAAATAAASLAFPFTLTARAECYLVGHPKPFEESVARVNMYREAGADCLYVPGIKDAETIGRLVKEVDGPVNVVMGLAGSPMSVNQLEDLGVKRVSIGGSLARATFGLIRRAAEEMRGHGTFTYSEQQVPDAELCRFFAARRES